MKPATPKEHYDQRKAQLFRDYQEALVDGNDMITKGLWDGSDVYVNNEQARKAWENYTEEDAEREFKVVQSQEQVATGAPLLHKSPIVVESNDQPNAVKHKEQPKQ